MKVGKEGRVGLMNQLINKRNAVDIYWLIKYANESIYVAHFEFFFFRENP